MNFNAKLGIKKENSMPFVNNAVRRAMDVCGREEGVSLSDIDSSGSYAIVPVAKMLQAAVVRGSSSCASGLLL